MKVTLKAATFNIGLTQKEAGDEIGVSVDTIGKWERGESFPSSKYIPAITKTYRISYDDIIFLRNSYA